MTTGERLQLGSYEPLVELAKGGMATVYVARRLGAAGFERLVAIKRVHGHLVDNREFHDMFRDEARVSSLIRHANVVSATDVVEWSGELFLVMDYVESVSLARLGGGHALRFPPPIASRILGDVLSGLHAAHEAVDLRGARLDVIHRDVSPQNVIIGTDGVSRLIDFGIAKAAARLAETSQGALRGKLRYMSPEQVKQQPLDRRADVFAAGVVLYELLTGARTFTGEDEGDIMLAILVGKVAPPSQAAPAVSPALDRVVARALERDRDVRFATAADMQTALEEACPPATHREVAAFVSERAGGELERQRRAVRDALDGARVGISTPKTLSGASQPRPERDRTGAAARTEPGARPRSRIVRAALGAAVLLALGGTAVIALAPWRTSAPIDAPAGRLPPSAAAGSGAFAEPGATPPAPPALAEPPPAPRAGPSTTTSAITSARPTAPSPLHAPAHPRPSSELHRNPYRR